jgi:hypothetical protein
MTFVIVTTVGLGIGATTTIFAAIDAALLRELPYADPAQLVRIYTDAPPNRFPFSVADYFALEAQQTTFERIAAYSSEQMSYTDGVTAERLQGRRVTWTYFGTLGVRPASGRDFNMAEGTSGGPRVESRHTLPPRRRARNDDCRDRGRPRLTDVLLGGAGDGRLAVRRRGRRSCDVLERRRTPRSGRARGVCAACPSRHRHVACVRPEG